MNGCRHVKDSTKRMILHDHGIVMECILIHDSRGSTRHGRLTMMTMMMLIATTTSVTTKSYNSRLFWHHPSHPNVDLAGHGGWLMRLLRGL
jgi:hypothetical protein